MDLWKCNQRLLEWHGRHRYDSRAIFRVVIAGEETEKRLGTFNDFSGDLWIRQVTEVREVPKYPYLPPQTYVLESLRPNALPQEIKEGPLIYDIVWALLDKDDNPLPLRWQPIELIIYNLFNPAAKKSAQTLADEERVAFDKEVEINKEILQNANPLMNSKIRTGEAIYAPGFPKEEEV